MPEFEAPLEVTESNRTSPVPSLAEESLYSESPVPSDNEVLSETSSESIGDTYTLQAPGYEKIRIPLEQNMRQMLMKVTDTPDLERVTSLRLQVLASEFSLNRIPNYIPHLTELNLTGSVLMSLRDLGCDMSGLRILNVTRTGLTSLDGLMGLSNIVQLFAGSNKIDDLSPCAFLPGIEVLDLKNNVIKDVTSVGFLILCESLRHVSLEGNPTAEIKNYRSTIKRTLPMLLSLDGKEFTPDEDRNLEENCEEGPSRRTCTSRFPPIEKSKSTNTKRPLTTDLATLHKRKLLPLATRPWTARRATEHSHFTGMLDGCELKLQDAHSYLQNLATQPFQGKPLKLKKSQHAWQSVENN